MPDISIGRLRGGFCVYWYDGGQRKRYQLKARTRKAAEAEAIDVWRRNLGPSHGDATVANCLSAYADFLGDRPAGKTLGYIRHSLGDHFGHYRPDQITRQICASYRSGEGDCSQGTRHTELGHLRSALNYAAKVGMIDNAPYIWRPSKPQTDKRILNAGEARKLIDSCNAPHVRLAVILLLGTAGRVGAVLDLDWSRVDFERGTINLRLDNAATRKGRAVVPMNGMTRAALSAAHEAALSDYVVEYAADRVKSIRKGFHNAVERSGIGHVRIHDIRHTAAVTMLAAGTPLEMVSQVLGHSNTQITFNTYARYLPQHMAPAVDVLNFTDLRNARS